MPLQVRDKMNRWNNFVDRMTPKKNYLKNNATRKPATGPIDEPTVPGKLKNRATGTIGASYLKRRDDVGSVSQHIDTDRRPTDGRPTEGNFAWVD